MTTAGSSPRVLSLPPERRQHPLHPHSYPQQHWERALSLCAWTQQAALESRPLFHPFGFFHKLRIAC